MSLVPMLFSNWWEDLDRPHRLFDQHFGHGLHPEDLEIPISPLTEAMVARPHQFHRRTAHRHPYQSYHPYDRNLAMSRKSGGTSTVHTNKDKFQVTLDVQQFRPEEVSVKVVGKNVVIDGKHEEKKDEHGWISRQFTRKYLVPEQCDIEQLSSSLSSDGVLIITAPRKALPEDEKNERIIQIKHTGQPALKDVASTNGSTTDSEKEQASQTKSPAPQQQRASDKTVKAA